MIQLPRQTSLLTSFFPVFEAVRYPIMLVGTHGIGKSTLVKEYAQAKNYRYEEVRAAQIDAVDILGIPTTVDDVLVWTPPHWLRQACQEPTVIFLDEYNRARDIVRSALFQLLDSKRIGMNHLHPDSRVFGAINPDADEYAVNAFDAAEHDRWFVIHFEPTAAEWLNWARLNHVHPAIINFVDQQRDELDPTPGNEGKVDNSRRSWDRLSQALWRFKSISERDLILLCKGYLNEETAKSFAEYYMLFLSKQESAPTRIKILKGAPVSSAELIFLLGKMKDPDWQEFAKHTKGLLRLALAIAQLKNMEVVELALEAIYRIESEELLDVVLTTEIVDGYPLPAFLKNMKPG